MNRRLFSLIFALIVVVCAGCAQAPGKPSGPPAAVVERLDIHTRKPAFGGQAFGERGAYELVAGVATVRVDPHHPANAAVADLALAADSDGMVRFRTDVVLLKPVAGAARTLVVEVANRGNKLALMWLADGGIQYDTAAQAGNGWAMRQGLVLAWIGWQGDVAPGKAGASVGTQFPFARREGQPITGRSADEFIFDNAEPRNTAVLAYPAARREPGSAQLTVRATPQATPTAVPPGSWRWLDDRRIEIDRPAGFDGGAIYEFVYEARDPTVMGLGMVALRELTLFLQSGQADAAGQPNPLAGMTPTTTIGFGISQSGRFLRDFVWQGFNAAPGGGRVFDGVMALIAGSRKSYVNTRFAQPGRYSRQHEDHWYPGDQFPFSYATGVDPVSGRRDGIFQRCAADRTCPKFMHLDSSLEFWQARASLVGTDVGGAALPQPEDVRLYLMAGTQHSPAAQPVAGICQQPNNPAVQAPLVRALFARLVGWSATGTPPPASRYPGPADLALPERAAVGFPDLSGWGVQFPGVINALHLVDAAQVPPRPDLARPYPVRVPRTDSDGHDLGGVQLPDVAVPLATHTGWNLRRTGFAPGELCGLNGMFVPLAADAAQRAAHRDPRPSLQERYGRRSVYVDRVRASVQQLVGQGLLIEEDGQRIVDKARAAPALAALPE